MKKAILFSIFIFFALLVSCIETDNSKVEKKYMDIICSCLNNSSTSKEAAFCIKSNNVTEENLKKENLSITDLLTKTSTYCK